MCVVYKNCVLYICVCCVYFIALSVQLIFARLISCVDFFDDFIILILMRRQFGNFMSYSAINPGFISWETK